ncbi:MAG: hypothetical protein AMXMBFR82_34880 [Candidatus Hydrogenedentota bacterium]
MVRVMVCVFLFAATALATLQESIDANPGQLVEVPPGEIHIDRPLRITTPGSGLFGQGTIVQDNPEANILEIAGTEDIRIEGITLTRAEGKQDSNRHAIHIGNSERVDLRGIRVIDNRSTAGTVYFENSRSSSMRDSTVINYKRVGVDDRTASELYGYAFRVIDGTGIVVNGSTDISIQDNQVVERNIFPTKEFKEEHNLGQLTDGAHPTKKGRLAPKGDYANNWHQGSAIVVTSPEKTSHVLVEGNLIENAAQGIDIHADSVTCANNVIDHAFVGIKCMHGSRNVIIMGNNVSHMDLWGLIMMPGTASHPAEAATDTEPARGANFTRGNIIANNIFSDFGFGYEYFNWEGSRGGVISLESGQLPENPIMTDVLIQGNIVYDTGRDQVLEDGQPVTIEPRYEYAVFITPEPRPEGLVFRDNIFHSGRGGISNIPLSH